MRAEGHAIGCEGIDAGGFRVAFSPRRGILFAAAGDAPASRPLQLATGAIVGRFFVCLRESRECLSVITQAQTDWTRNEWKEGRERDFTPTKKRVVKILRLGRAQSSSKLTFLRLPRLKRKRERAASIPIAQLSSVSVAPSYASALLAGSSGSRSRSRSSGLEQLAKRRHRRISFFIPQI